MPETLMAAEIRDTPSAVARLLDRQGPTLAVLGRSLRARDPAVVVSVSQSGRSPDIVALQAAARTAGAFSIAVVDEAASPLAEGADVLVPLGAGVERSVAATNTCLASAAALAAPVAEWRDDDALRAAVAGLPAALDAALALDWDAALPEFRTATSACLVGRGPALPVAAVAALKLKETAVLHAEAFSGAEVMHGPLELLEPGFPVMAFAQNDASRGAMRGSAAQRGAAGGRVFTVCAEGGDLPSAPTGHPPLDPLPMLLGFYGFAEKLPRGHDPDRPGHLRKVTETI